MPAILTAKEAKSFYKWSLWTRPAITYAMCLCILAMIATICYLLIAGKATLVDASALLMTIFGAFSPVLTSIVLGKSYERGRGINSENEALRNVIPSNPDASPDSIGNLKDVPQSSGGAIPFEVDDASAALDALHATDVSGYEAKVADDKPPLPDNK